MEDLSIRCGLFVNFNHSCFSNRIIDSMGGDFDVKKSLVSSLGKEEFVVSTRDTESVFSLSNLEEDRYDSL
jgi:hypothetical protein